MNSPLFIIPKQDDKRLEPTQIPNSTGLFDYIDIFYRVLTFLDFPVILNLCRVSKKTRKWIHGFEMVVGVVLKITVKFASQFDFRFAGYKLIPNSVIVLYRESPNFNHELDRLQLILESRISKFKIIPWMVDSSDVANDSQRITSILSLVGNELPFNPYRYLYCCCPASIPIAPGLELLEIDDLQNDLHLKFIDSNMQPIEYNPASLKELVIRSQGYFNGDDACISTEKLGKLLSNSIRKLELHGPFLQTMLNNPLTFVKMLLPLENVVSLMLDIDCGRIPPRIILGLLKLPKMKRFGRLYNLDGKFWRLVPRIAFPNIIEIHIGRIVYPNSPYFIETPKFLGDVGFGIKWSFPNIEN